MNLLKTALSTALALVTINYTSSCRIFLVVDASGTGWGAALEQEDKDGKQHPARFESRIWSKAERKYDAVKLECRGLLHALKKMHVWLWDATFTVETDAKTLVYQLNQAASNLPGALVTRWIAWIQLWDFDI